MTIGTSYLGGAGLGGAYLGSSGLVKIIGVAIRVLYRSGFLDSALKLVAQRQQDLQPYNSGINAPVAVVDHDAVSRQHYPRESALGEEGLTGTNFFLNSAAPVTQDIQVTSGNTYILHSSGTYSYTVSGAASGTLTGTAQDKRLTMTASSTGTATITVTTAGAYAQFEDSSTYTDTAKPLPYIPTTGAAASQTFGHINDGTTVDGSGVITWGANTPTTTEPLVIGTDTISPFAPVAIWPSTASGAVGLVIKIDTDYADSVLTGIENMVSVEGDVDDLLHVDVGLVGSTIATSTVTIAHTWSAHDALFMYLVVSEQENHHQVGVNGNWGTAGSLT